MLLPHFSLGCCETLVLPGGQHGLLLLIESCINDVPSEGYQGTGVNSSDNFADGSGVHGLVGSGPVPGLGRPQAKKCAHPDHVSAGLDG